MANKSSVHYFKALYVIAWYIYHTIVDVYQQSTYRSTGFVFSKNKREVLKINARIQSVRKVDLDLQIGLEQVIDSFAYLTTPNKNNEFCSKQPFMCFSRFFRSIWKVQTGNRDYSF